MAQDETRKDPPELSAIDVGLLTIAARRGSVSTPEVTDHRNDPASVSRYDTLMRLCEEGFLAVAPTEVRGEVAFALTDKGRAALAEVDAKGSPNP